jgi:small subunit ribosomal protein S16
MLKIRLAPKGVANKPFYRIVVTDERQKITGTPLAVLGYWQPGKDSLTLDKEKIKEWEGKGAKITPAVAKLIKK